RTRQLKASHETSRLMKWAGLSREARGIISRGFRTGFQFIAVSNQELHLAAARFLQKDVVGLEPNLDRFITLPRLREWFSFITRGVLPHDHGVTEAHGHLEVRVSTHYWSVIQIKKHVIALLFLYFHESSHCVTLLHCSHKRCSGHDRKHSKRDNSAAPHRYKYSSSYPKTGDEKNRPSESVTTLTIQKKKAPEESPAPMVKSIRSRRCRSNRTGGG